MMSTCSPSTMGLTRQVAEASAGAKTRWPGQHRPSHDRGLAAFASRRGALVLVQPAGCAVAYAPSTWLTIEELNTEG